MTKVAELFGHSTANRDDDWAEIIGSQRCPFLGRRCYKIRKSDATVSIGTCTVQYGNPPQPLMICPTRLIDRRQIFVDCIHLLTQHEPGNELHVVSEVTIPGGSVDYFLVSVRDGKVRDFVGIELQTLDTTGTVWPERQRLLREFGIARTDDAEDSFKTFGMNWKMTAKTILVQMHHKVQTFEHISKKLVLVVQDDLLKYMTGEFSFNHLHAPASLGDSMHFHSYRMAQQKNTSYNLFMHSRFSTDAEGIALCMGLRAEARIEFEVIIKALQSRISPNTLFTPLCADHGAV